MHLVTIGTDVEFVGKHGDKIIPLTPDLIEGNKQEPHIIDADFEVGVQLDNILGELTFKPAEDFGQFTWLCAHAEECLKQYLKKRGVHPIWKTHHTFKTHETMSTWAKTVGCEMDYPADIKDDPDAYPSVADSNVRTASGHLHFGLSEKLSADEVIQYVRGLDFMIGAPLMLAHNDHIRRRYYGQAGRFRFKPYGFEYRTPDSWWFSRHDYMASRIFNQAAELFSNSPSKGFWRSINKMHSELCSGINSGDKDKVRKLVDRAGLPKLSTKKSPPKAKQKNRTLKSLGAAPVPTWLTEDGIDQPTGVTFTTTYQGDHNAD